MSREHPRVITELADHYGYGLQVARGLGRFRIKRPNWIFLRCSIADLKYLHPQSFVGAIGHYVEIGQLNALKKYQVPFYVSVSSRGESDWWPRVIPNDHEVGRMAADYFLRKGYKHFGVSMVGKMVFATHRREGFLGRLREAGIDDVAEFRTNTDLPEASRLPMGLFANSDSRALSHINRFIENGLKVPEDVSVLGADDDELAALYAPVPISSVKLPLEKIGFAACELLESMIASGKQDYGTYRFSPIGVIERRSTDAFAVKDQSVRRAQAYMEEHLADISEVDSLALALHMNRRTLERKFEQGVGMSPAAWLLRRRTEYAEKLLLETDYTVDHVAELAGLEDRRRLYRALHKLGRPLPSVIRARK